MQTTIFIKVCIVSSLIVLLAPDSTYGRPTEEKINFIDGVPLLSQLKSLIQVIKGDPEGAKKTQENFTMQAPWLSQGRSIYETLSGDKEGAKKTADRFGKGYIKPIIDGFQ